MSELNEIFEALGRLEEQGEESQRQRRRLFGKVEEVQAAVAPYGPRLDHLEKTHAEETRPVLEDYKKTKAKGFGVLVGLGLVTGSVGAHFDKAWTAFKSALGL